ncbi:hypothetical protein Tco_0091638 [Tanacetum coccineum]
MSVAIGRGVKSITRPKIILWVKVRLTIRLQLTTTTTLLSKKRASKAKKNDTKEKEPPKDWTTMKEIALCQAWCDVSENSKKGNSMKAKRFWEAVIKIQRGEENPRFLKPPRGQISGAFNLNNEAGEFEEETQEHRPMGHDRSKKKKSSASSREGSSSFVDLVADKFFNIKSTK